MRKLTVILEFEEREGEDLRETQSVAVAAVYNTRRTPDAWFWDLSGEDDES